MRQSGSKRLLQWKGPVTGRRSVLRMLSSLGIAGVGGGLIGGRIRAESHGGDKIIKSHGYSYFGELKYPEGFTHFDYVNPDAPKGGEMVLDALGTFDSLNPYSRKGRASGTWIWETYESLLGDGPADAYGEQYGLLAESLEYDEGKNWVIFHMRPEARFSDGTPVTAHDVVFSHNLLLEQGLPSYAQAVKIRILTSEALDDHTVKFTFAPDISRRSLIDQAGGVPVWSKAWYEKTGARLDESRLEVSPGSAPYVLDSYEVNRRVVYKRNPDYWGKDLPINRGRHNFDEIRIEYYGDDTAAFEAFKAGQYTFRQEGDSKTWATSYDFPAVEKGWVKREEIPTMVPPTPTGFVFNLGREKLKDKRVREALALAYNFEWTNTSLQFGLFEQRTSFVENAPHQAKAAPTGEELALLTSLGDLVPSEMLEEPAVTPHASKPNRLNDRRNLRRAMKLLDEAGWTVQDDGLRRNAQGQVLTLDFPYPSSAGPTLGPVIEAYARNLAILGVDVNLEKIDPAQYTLRSRERDYDMVFDNYRTFLEAGTGLMQMYGSKEAKFSLFNPAGLESPLVDAIIQKALHSQTKDEETAALMALDRALRYERFMVPVWYNPNSWVAYWDMYDHPDPLPPYDLGYLDFWWYNEEKAARLKSEGALR